MSKRSSSDPSSSLLQAVFETPVKFSYLWAIPALLTAYAAATIIYRLWLSPLSKLPGPLVAKITGQWIFVINLAGNRARYIHNLHSKYGPVVQVGPKEVSFSGIETIHDIYETPGDCNKAPIYAHRTRLGVFAMQDPVAHKQRRRLMTHVFAQVNVNAMEPNIRDQIKLLIEVIERHQPEAIDVRQWMRMLSLDISGGSFLGKTFGSLDSDTPPQYVNDLDDVWVVWSLQNSFPTLTWLAKQIPHPKVKWFFDTDNRFYQYGYDALDEYIRRYGRVSQRRDLLTKLIGDKEDDPEAIPDRDIRVELSNLLLAATDTSSLTLTCLFWELANNPKIQTQLRDELKSVPDYDGFPLHKDLASLPFLNGVIKESMRRYPPAPSGLERITPPEGKAIGGVFVPGRTVVASHTYTLHHSPTHFPHPYVFDPTRWNKGGTDEMKQLYMPFSKGPRDCMGQSMALLEIRLTVAALLMKYEVLVDEKTKDDDMEMTDHFIFILKGEKCWLRFKPIAKN